MEASDPVSPSDEDIFAEIYPSLRRFAAAVRPVGIGPEDLVQEALARTLAIHQLAALDEPSIYLRTAMVRIASNLQRSRRRANARLARLDRRREMLDRYPSDLADLLRVAPRARAISFLTVVEGETYASVAPIVGCSEAAARAIASRALQKLRRELTTELDSKDTR